MAVISTRDPFYIEQNATSLKVEVKVWNTVDSEPASYAHSFEKSSYEVGVAEDLRINISPIIRPYFDMIPLVSPTSGDLVSVDEVMNVKLLINEATEQNYTAVFGFEAPVSPEYFGKWQSRKAIHYNTDSYITIPETAVDAIYNTSDGQQHVESLSAKSRYQVIPVAHPSIDLSTAKWLSITVGIITYYYDVICPYMDGTISYVDSSGLWESFDVNGRQDYTYESKGQEFIQYSTGFKKQFNVNGLRSVRVNTGWVDEDFRRVIEDLMLSEHIVWNYGNKYERMILKTSNTRRKLVRTDKMMEYTLNFEFATPMIEIDSGAPLPANYKSYRV